MPLSTHYLMELSLEEDVVDRSDDLELLLNLEEDEVDMGEPNPVFVAAQQLGHKLIVCNTKVCIRTHVVVVHLKLIITTS